MNIDNKFINISDPFINDKTLFDIKYNKIEIYPNKGELFNHQQFAVNYMKYNDRVLVISKPGTGKTCLAVGVAEYFNDLYFLDPTISRITNCLIITRGDTLAENFKNSILNICTNNKYIVNEDFSSQSKKIRTKKILSNFYSFETMESFANKLSTLTNDALIRLYNKTLFIFDEIQNIPTSSSSKSNIYEQYYRIFNLLNRCKILLLSATPIVNEPQEFVKIMNLILPNSKKLSENIDWENLNENDFKNIQGYILFSEKFEAFDNVNYLKYIENEKQNTNLNKIRINNSYNECGFTITDKKNIHYSVNGCLMYGIQSALYSGYIADNITQEELENPSSRDNEKKINEIASNFYLDAREICNFVYPLPDGVDIEPYGNSAYNYYFEEKNLQKLNYKMEFLRKNIKTNLINYSSKYYKVLMYIKYLSDNNMFTKAFINSLSVEGSGLKVFCLCLEEILKFIPFDASQELTSNTFKNMEKAKRYFILTGKNTESQIKNFLSIYNHPENKNGEYISLILGSKVTNEGLSFYNTPDIFLLSTNWNVTNEYQTINRILRIGSFNLNLEDGDVDVRIHRFVSYYKKINKNGIYDEVTEIQPLDVYDKNNIPFKLIEIKNDHKLLSNFKERKINELENWSSVEYYIYNLSLKKEEQISKAMYIIKQYASDCINGKNRNILSEEYDYSYDCNFKKCDYKCLPVDDVQYSINDYSKYINNQKNINNIILILKALFSVNTIIDIQSLISILIDKLNIDKISVIFGLGDIFVSKLTITDKYGSLKYIIYKNGFVTLSNKNYNNDDIYYLDNMTILDPIDIFEDKKLENYEIYEEKFKNIDYSKITIDDRLNDKSALRYFFNINIIILTKIRGRVISRESQNVDVNILPIIDYEKISSSNYIYRFYTADGPIRYKFKNENLWKTASNDPQGENYEIWYPIRIELVKILFDWINYYRNTYPIIMTVDNKGIFSAKSEYTKNEFIDNNNIKRIPSDDNKNVLYGIVTPYKTFNICYINKNTENLKSLIYGRLCNTTKTEELYEICKIFNIDYNKKQQRQEICENIFNYLKKNNKILYLNYE